MKFLGKQKVSFLSYLDYIFMQENVSEKYKGSVRTCFIKFLAFCKNSFRNIFMKKHDKRNKHFYIKRFSYKAVYKYLHALNKKPSTKRRIYYILNKYIHFFNKKPHAKLNFKKISDYKPNKNYTNKNAYTIINFLKSKELNEDLLLIYMLEYLGLSLYAISKLRTNEFKVGAGKVKLSFYYNRKHINKVLAPEVYELVKEKLTKALENNQKAVFYASFRETKAKSRKEKIENTLIKLYKKAGLNNSSIKELIKKYNTERPAKTLTNKEQNIFSADVEIGNGLIDEELSVFE